MSKKPKKTEEEIEAEREMRENEARMKAEEDALMATLTKDQRYYRRHRAKRICDSAKQRAAKRRAAPPWLTKEHDRQFLAVYEAAESMTKQTGTKCEVDHIVPLVGRNKAGDHVICGLHVPWNVRAAPQSMNRSRGNWFYIADAEREVDERDNILFAKAPFDVGGFDDDGDKACPF